MNLFWHELRQYRKALIIWTLSISATVVFFLSIFPSYSADAELVAKLFSSFPEAVRKAFGLDIQNFLTPLGFYAYILTFVIVTGAVQATNIGAGIVSKEGAGKTVDFLMSKPISRNKILGSKLAASLVMLVTTNVAFIASALTMAVLVSERDFSIQTFVLLSGILFLVQIMFFAIGFLISVSVTKIKSVVSVSLPLVFAFFTVGIFDSVLGIENVRYMTPFKFYDPNSVLKDGRYELRFLVIEAVFVVAAIVTSFVIYSRKDIKSVT